MNEVIKAVIKVTLILSTLLSAIYFLSFRETKLLTEELRASTGNSYIKLSQGFTEYEIGGDSHGIPIVLVHGMSVGMYDWDNQYEYLISRGYRVLRYNHFGRGYSDRPNVVYDRELYTTQLNEMINAFFDGNVNIVGHSLGGAITTEYAINNCNVDKVVLISPILYPSRSSKGVKLLQIPVIGDYSASTILSPLLIKRAERLFNSGKLKNGEKYFRYFDSQTRVKGFSRSVKSLFRNNAMGDYTESYRKIKEGSALLIWGTADKSVSERDIDIITQINPGIDTMFFDSVGHSPNFEIADIVNKEIDKFIKGV